MYGRLLRERAEIPRWLYERRKIILKSNFSQITSPSMTSPCSQDQSASTLILRDIQPCCIPPSSRSGHQLIRLSPTMLVRPKIKLKFVAYFFAAKITRLLHHVYHADHHVLTIKKPSPETRISQNTPQKHQQMHHSQDQHHDKKNLRLNSYSGY